MKTKQIPIFILLIVSVLAPRLLSGAEASRPPDPIFTVVVISDNHFWFTETENRDAVWSGSKNSRLLSALKFTNEVIKPDFVIFCGDQILGMGTNNPPLELEKKISLLFEKLVDEKLDMPFLFVYGNHDGYAYPALYGDGNFSVDYKGVRFLLLGIEFTPDFSGSGYFTKWEWLDVELKEAKGRPVLVFIHTPMYFPTFNNAITVKGKLEKAGNVLGVIAGHNHKELLNQSMGIPHFTMPQVIREPGYAFMRMDFYADRIVLRAVEKDGPEAEYKQDRIIIEIPIPEKLRPLNPDLSEPVAQPRLEQESKP